MLNRPIILVAEDEILIQEVMRAFIEDAGMVPVCASSAEEANALLDQNPGIDAAFLDIDLGPKGTGFQVARHARETHPHLPIIYTSGAFQPRFGDERVEDADFVPKPYSPEAVAGRLRAAVKG